MKKISFSNLYRAVICLLYNPILWFRTSRLSILVVLFLSVLDSYSQTPIDLSRPVGMTEGVAGTNGSGAGTYAISIDLPDGIGGYKPPVSLSYSSQGNGNGFSGQGWSLAPISLISRNGKNVFQDGESKPINYTSSNDAFTLDGQRLMLKSGVYGADGGTYGTEQESFSEITSHGVWYDAPESFGVKMKDGSSLSYGTDNTYLGTYSGYSKIYWLLSTVNDAAGNLRAKYYYNIDIPDRSFNLSQIVYSNYKVVFSYDIKTDWSSAATYISGEQVNSKYILNRIDVRKLDDTQISSYTFSYQYRHKKYFLTNVTEAGADGTTLNPITFTYGENVAAPDVIIPSIEYTGFSEDNFAADFTGDGKDDIQTYGYQTDNDQIRNYTGYKITNDYSSYAGMAAVNWEYSYTLPTHPTNGRTMLVGSVSAQYPFSTSDYDGDGKQDVLYCKFEKVNSNTLKIQGVEVNYSRKYYSLGGGFNTYENKAYYPYPSDGATTFFYTKQGGSFFTSGDFDGDGHVDYILILSNLTTANNFKAFLSTPSKGIVNREITNFGVGVNGASGSYAAYKVAESPSIIPINFDGDGKTELLVMRGEGSYVLSINGNSTSGYSSTVLNSNTSIKSGYPIYPGDFNGDGNTDLLVRSGANDPYASWSIFYSTGQAFSSASFVPSRRIYLKGDGSSLFHNFTVADYDGDGRTDIWHSVDETTITSTQYVYYSNGISFTVESYAQNTGVNTFLSTVSGDFNGDGKADLLSIRRYGSSPSHTFNGRFIMAKPFKEQNLLKEVSNLGYMTSFHYGLLNNAYSGSGGSSGNVYSRSSSEELDTYPVQPLRSNMVPKLAMYVLSSIERPNGIGSHFNEEYRYEDLVVHRQGRGFLGFKKVTVINDLNVYTINTSNIDLTYSMLYPTLQQSSLGGYSTISQSNITTSFQSLPGGRFFVKTDRIQSVNYLTSASSDVSNTYDSYGNITQSTAQAGIESATTNTAYGTYGGAPYPGFPTSVTVSKTRGAEPTVSKTTNYTYTIQGWPQTVTEYVGTPIAQTVTNTYNGLGLITQSSVSAPGVTTPVSEYVYDGTGNYLLEKRLIGGGITKKESYTYDTRWGIPLTETSADGLTTSYVYNTFGDLVQTNFADGNSVSTIRVWETSGNALMSSLTQRTDGSVPVKVYADILSREIKAEKRGFGNHWITSTRSYNYLGQLESETAPSYSWEPVNGTTYSYDTYGRPSVTSNTTGAITTSYSTSGSDFTVTTMNAAGQTFSKITDVSGKLITSIDNGIAINFTYDSWGNQLTAPFTVNVYDNYGRKISTTDNANGHTYTYQYNSIGQLTQQTDESSNVQTMTYDVFGRVSTTTGTQGTTTNTYYFDGATGNSNDNLTQVVGFSGDVTTYTYDALQRLNSETITASGSGLTKTHTYDSRSRLATTTYPAGFLIRHIYDDNDIEIETKYELGATVKTLFTATSMNSRGIYTGYNTGNGKSKQVTWDYTREMVSRYFTAGVQNLNLVYEANTGNLLSRADGIKGLTETFTYTNEDRLKTATVNGVQQFSINFDTDGQGRIWQKTTVGNYDYNLYYGHRLDALSPIGSEPDPDLTMGPQTYSITYTAFKRPQTISHNNGYSVNFVYGSDQQRLTSELKYGGATVATKSYWGNIEGLTKGGVSYEIYYIAAGNGLNNIIVKQGSAISIYYTYTDQLGSIVAVTDESGATVAEQNFDAWGRKRNPANWTYGSVPAVPDWLYRGFTGHEHIDEIGLINMNARMYDPTTGQMLAPDNFISLPHRLSGYNRYLYADGNPLKYTDPTGNWIHLVIGAIVGGVVNLVSNAIQGKIDNFWDGLKSFGVGALAGAVGAGVGAGVSTAIAGGSFAAGFVGTTSVASTGFFAGAASGAAGGGSSGFILGVGNSLLQGNSFGSSIKQGFSYGTIGAISGGVVGGVAGGIDALTKNTNFFNGTAKASLKEGYGAYNIPKNLDANSTIKIRYVGKYEGVRMFETPSLGQGGGITLPGFGITVGDGAFSRALDMPLVHHEFGHILQYRRLGASVFYRYIGGSSSVSAGLEGVKGHVHRTFWTETWANYLSQQKFGSGYFADALRFPVKDLDWWLKLLLFYAK